MKYIAENSGPTAVFKLSDGFEKLTFELPKFDCICLKFNPIAFKGTKIVYSFGLSECNRVN